MCLVPVTSTTGCFNNFNDTFKEIKKEFEMIIVRAIFRARVQQY